MDKIDLSSIQSTQTTQTIIFCETNQSYLSLFKKNNTNKCSPKKKCPCRTWINCEYYIDIIQQDIRLKLKNPKRINEIDKWYSTYFKFDGDFHDLYCSG